MKIVLIVMSVWVFIIAVLILNLIQLSVRKWLRDRKSKMEATMWFYEEESQPIKPKKQNEPKDNDWRKKPKVSFDTQHSRDQVRKPKY